MLNSTIQEATSIHVEDLSGLLADTEYVMDGNASDANIAICKLSVCAKAVLDESFSLLKMVDSFSRAYRFSNEMGGVLFDTVADPTARKHCTDCASPASAWNDDLLTVDFDSACKLRDDILTRISDSVGTLSSYLENAEDEISELDDLLEEYGDTMHRLSQTAMKMKSSSRFSHVCG